jgi:hypothetical protein
MNEALVAPVFKSVSTHVCRARTCDSCHGGWCCCCCCSAAIALWESAQSSRVRALHGRHWERAFISGLNATLDSLRAAVAADLEPFHDGLLAALGDAGVSDGATAGVHGIKVDALLAKLRAAVGAVQEATQKAQRDLSREMEPVIASQMAPGYTAATAEAGTGSHRRRVDRIEAHVQKRAPDMFDEAAGGVVSKLDELRTSIGKTLEADVVQGTIGSLTSTYTPLWDEVGEEARVARHKLAPRVREILIEASNAVNRLHRSPGGATSGGAAASGGSSGAAGDDDDDDDLVDVTEGEAAAKRARQQEAAIDLDDENLGENLCRVHDADGPPPRRQKMGATHNAQASGSADVFVAKSE